jgi:hypothetical protein
VKATALPLRLVLLATFAVPAHAQTASPQKSQTAATSSTIVPLAELEKLLPATVFFQGQTAPIQLRNAGAARFADGALVFAALVDTAGYSSNVRQRYQFYLVTEAQLNIAGKPLAPGAYGAGFLEDGSFAVMDIGGHEVLLSKTETQADLRRPRPLQLVTGNSAAELRLFLGRSFVAISRARQ